jgi:hypothetical protein
VGEPAIARIGILLKSQDILIELNFRETGKAAAQPAECDPDADPSQP